jgi:hypothetical protein
MRYPTTPDKRYFVVRGRLWRCSNPSLGEDERRRIVGPLMRARSDVRRALRSNDGHVEKQARADVHAAKVALGERGEPWWDDGAPDFNRHLVKNTPYADWYAALGGED